MTIKEVLKDVESMIGEDFDENEIIVAFSDCFGEEPIYVSDTTMTYEDNGHVYRRYQAYADGHEKEGLMINVDEDSNKIHSVYLASECDFYWKW